MATVTGMTAAKMQEIYDASVVGGEVDENGHLILQRESGLLIDAGYVVGPKGDQGDMPAFDFQATSGGIGFSVTGEGDDDNPFVVMASLPEQLSSKSRVVTNWNDAVDSGFYVGIGATNYPETKPLNSDSVVTSFHGVVVSEGASNRVTQKLYPLTASQNGVTWSRYYNGTSWTAWVLHDSRDTGWINFPTLQNNAAPQSGIMPQYRRIGNKVYFRWGISISAMSTGNTTIATIPEAFRPQNPSVYMPAVGGVGDNFSSWYITQNGTVQLRRSGSSTSDYMLFPAEIGYFTNG